jgi:hypothetical protein
MQSEKDKAEQYVREKLPELMELSFGCVVQPYGLNHPENYCTILGKIATSDYDFKCYNLTTNKHQLLNQEEMKFIFGHPIEYRHWMQELEKHLDVDRYYYRTDGRVMYEDHGVNFEKIRFDLTTGQPASEADYKAFNDIVGI